MHISNSDLLDWRLKLHRGESIPIEAQLEFVEARLREKDVIAGGINYATRGDLERAWGDGDEE